MSIIIGLDPSLNSSGITILGEGGNPIKFEVILPSPLNGAERLRYNYQRYCNIFSSYENVRCIAFEKQVSQMRFNHNASNILDLAENIGIMKMAIATVARLNQPQLLVLGFTPAEIKTHATGKSNADKETMISSMPKRHQTAMKKHIPEYSWDDAADSYHAARYANKLLTMGEDITPYLFKDYRSL